MEEHIGAEPRRSLRRRTIWDVVMVTLAVVDLLFLAFDFTYVSMRPVYLDVAPRVVSLYDPVKGMQPHPTSQRLLREMKRTRTYLESLGPKQRADPEWLAEQVSALRQLSRRVLSEDSFAHLDGANHDRVMREVVGRLTDVAPADLGQASALRSAVERLWPADQAQLAAVLMLPESVLVRPLQRNFFRQMEIDGEPVDYFSLLEAPLLLIFWLDFWVGWMLAARRVPGQAWYRYPLAHWYDLLGLLPGKLRAFRLFRIVSIYVRLNRQELEQVRDNAVKRASRTVAEAVALEVTNRVQVSVVHRLESEIAAKTIQTALAESLQRHHTTIVELVIDQLRHLSSDPETRAGVHDLVALATEEALQSGNQRPFARRMTRNVVERVSEHVLDGLAHTLQSERGHQLLQELMISSAKRAHARPSFRRLEQVASEVSFEVVHAAGEAAQRRMWSAHNVAPPATPGGNATADAEPAAANSVGPYVVAAPPRSV